MVRTNVDVRSIVSVIAFNSLQVPGETRDCVVRYRPSVAGHL